MASLIANMGQTSRFFLAVFSIATVFARSESRQEDVSDVSPATIYLQDIDEMLSLCRVKNISTETAMTGYVYSHFQVIEGESPYANNMDCLIVIQTEATKRLNIRFNVFDLPPKYDKDLGKCSTNSDRLYIYNSADTNSIQNNYILPNVTLCGGMRKFPDDFQSMQNLVTVRFISDAITTSDVGFEFIYTPFEPQSESATDCFNCHNKDMCILNELLCNGVKNCNDDSDELSSICDKKALNFFDQAVEQYGLLLVSIVIAVIGIVILAFFLVCIICCYRKRRESEKEKATSSVGAGMHQARPKPYHNYPASSNRFASPSPAALAAESYGAPPYSESLQSSIPNGMNGVGGGHGVHGHHTPQPHHHYYQQQPVAPPPPQNHGSGYYGYQPNGGGGGGGGSHHNYHGYPNPSSGLSSFNGSVKYHPGHHPDSVSLPSNISRSYHSQSHSGHSDV